MYYFGISCLKLFNKLADRVLSTSPRVLNLIKQLSDLFCHYNRIDNCIPLYYSIASRTRTHCVVDKLLSDLYPLWQIIIFSV